MKKGTYGLSRRINRVSAWTAAGDKLARTLLYRRAKAARRKRYPILACLPHDRIGREIAAQGLFEEHALHALLELLRPRAEHLAHEVAVDVGANIGNHALVLARHFKRVIAFEPNPPAALLLRANIALNGTENVEVHEVALGEAAARLPFFSARGNLGNAGFADRFVHDKQAAGVLPLERGDDALADVQDRIALLKVDVEGLELSVLRGLRGMLSVHHPLVVFESQPAGDPHAIFSLLRELGYRHFYAIERPVLAPLRIRPRQLRALVDLLRRALRGNDYYLMALDALEDRYYATVLASVDPL